MAQLHNFNIHCIDCHWEFKLELEFPTKGHENFFMDCIRNGMMQDVIPKRCDICQEIYDLKREAGILSHESLH